MTKGYVEYSSNNSGGSWWLTDDHWKALEKAGWKVVWNWFTEDYDHEGIDADGMPKIVRKPEEGGKYFWDNVKEGERFLGALARTAYRSGLSLRKAADEWESITGMPSTDAGCPCCGQPHNFTEYDAEGTWVSHGPDTNYSASLWPLDH